MLWRLMLSMSSLFFSLVLGAILLGIVGGLMVWESVRAILRAPRECAPRAPHPPEDTVATALPDSSSDRLTLAQLAASDAFVGRHIGPSDEVDQAWHLHLVYTRSYWGEFCPNVLGKPLDT